MFAPIADQVVGVGQQLVLPVTATDKDGDNLDYTFSGKAPSMGKGAALTRLPNGGAEFQWTPTAADVGTWYVDFQVSDGIHHVVSTVQVQVKSAVGAGTAPIFRAPLGTGTTLDLDKDKCVHLGVVVDDAASPSVKIAQVPPLIQGAQLQASGALSADWNWCPSDAQIAADDRYTLTLSADDGESPKTLKHYLVVLRKSSKADCPGQAPTIMHTPQDQSTLDNVTISADISDDVGLKKDPLLYYSNQAPSDPIDLGKMTQLSMQLSSGDMQNGTWTVDIPNPVADKPAGTSATLYYVISAEDDDDPTGGCNHITQAPATATYTMTVTNPGGSGGLGLCEACTADVQCGDASDLCVPVGSQGGSSCLKACGSSVDCPSGYSCSPSPVQSVDGASARQCVPDSNTCTAPQTCTDDSYEENDSLAQAAENPPLDPGSYDLVSCPAAGSTTDDDEDWFQIDVTQDSQVSLSIDGGSQSDLDLELEDQSGQVIGSSMSLTSSEQISQCLAAGTYYVREFAWNPVQNPYTLTYSATAQSCAAVCQDDAAEPDDSASEARQTTIFPDPFVSQGNMICPGNDDWYEVDLYDSETVVVDLTFDQTSSDQDLDLHLIDPSGTDLTPCSESDPSTCTAAQGQSATSNEHLEYTIQNPDCVASLCPYYVKVHGWDGSSNSYDIQIGLQ